MMGNNVCPYCNEALDTGRNCYKQECIAARDYELYRSPVETINIPLIKRTNEERIVYMLEKILLKLELSF